LVVLVEAPAQVQEQTSSSCAARKTDKPSQAADSTGSGTCRHKQHRVAQAIVNNAQRADGSAWVHSVALVWGACTHNIKRFRRIISNHREC
jgi:hypothetical protein